MNTNFRDYFLSIFDKPIAQGIVEFGKTLSETQADIFIVMARKAACLVESMEELLLTRLDGHVTTDRILDIDLSWIKGKDVVIVDDVIVSGTTIYETIQTLEKAGAKSIRVIVIGINRDWFKSELISDENNYSYLLEPYLNLSNEECIKLCADIVTGLSIIPRPYSIDFPLYQNIRIKENIFDHLLTNFLWTCDDITTALQADNDVVNLTLSPNETFTANLETLLGFPIAKTSICKIRLYGKLNKSSQKSNKSFYRMRMVPFVVFKPIRKEDIEEMFQALKGHFPQYGHTLDENFISATSKLRLLQHIVGGYLGKLWINAINHLTVSEITMHQDYRAMSFLYPPHVIPMVEAIAAQDAQIFKNVTFEPIDIPFDPEPGYKSQISELNDLSISVKLTEAFLHLYREKELKSRQLVREKGKEVFSNPLYKSIVTRLKKGYPITFLYKLLEAAPNTVDIKKRVSLFLDRSIDAGIVVPITGEKNSILFRAYRHGEDVLFGENEEKLCLRVFSSFLKSSGKDSIPRLWTEKLFVLFVKIGVQKKFLSEFIYDNPPKEAVSMLSVKNYKFGQVTTIQDISPDDEEISPLYLTEDQKSQWLTSVLVERKLLRETNPGTNSYYKLVSEPKDELTQAAIIESESIGDLFGVLYKNGAERKAPRLGNKDMVLLTSCLTPHDIAASMAAEVFIFQTKWRDYKAWLRRDIVDESKMYDICASIREENSSWTAVNSGQDKYKGFLNKEGYEVIKRITSGLDDNRHMQRAWQLFWSANQEWTPESIQQPLADLHDRLAHWLFDANIIYRILDVLIRKLLQLNGIGSKMLEKHKAEIDQIKLELERIYQQKKSISNSELKTVEERTLNSRRDVLKRKIKLLNNGIQIISEEINKNFSDLNTYTSGESVTLKFLWIDVQAALGISNVDDFKNKKLISKTLQEFEKLYNRTKPLLDDVDILVSPYGKISLAVEYEHCLFVKLPEPNDQEKRHNEKKLADTLTEFTAQIFGGRKPTNAAMVSFTLLSKHLNFAGDGYIFCGRGELSRSRIIRLAVQIFEAFSSVPAVKMALLHDLPTDSRVRIPAKNTDGLKRGFLKHRILPICELLNEEAAGRFLYTSSFSPGFNASEFVPRDSNRYFEFNEEQVLSCRSPYEYNNYLTKFLPNKMDNSVDIGIITIVAPEARAVRDLLNDYVKVPGKQTTRTYHQGTLPGAGGFRHRVVMTQQLIQGNESVAPAYRDIISEFNPKLMVLFGIAGGIHKDVKLCDVVIANLVIDYDKRKIKEEDIARGTAYRISAVMQTLINEFQVEFGEVPEFEASENSFETKFKVRVGPIGSGNAVVANPLAEIKEWLSTFNDKTLAIETEAVGFSNAFYEEELSRNSSRIGALIIRGISDHADFDKDDKWRVPASENTAIALGNFVATLPDLSTYVK